MHHKLAALLLGGFFIFIFDSAVVPALAWRWDKAKQLFKRYSKGRRISA